MSDLIQILPLWESLRSAGADYVLATVIEVEGSGYRKPGARMLIAADGRRAGTVSGGCLEAEVARKAFWHTENGPVLRRYSTTPDDGDVPYGMGCGGVVHLLLERRATAEPVLEELAFAFAHRQPLAIATVTERDAIAQRAFQSPNRQAGSGVLAELAGRSFEERRSFTADLTGQDHQIAAVRVEWVPARPGLFIFGAGDDALPLLALARQLGWRISVADGRAHLVTATRFPLADELYTLDAAQPLPVRPQATDAAVIMTHSIEQDMRILGELLAGDLAYLGVLGPRHRTIEMLTSLARSHSGGAASAVSVHASVESSLARLHAPMGIDLGGSAPADIALSVIAEIQQTLHHASGRSLHELRAQSSPREKEPLAFPRNVSIA